MTNEKLRYISEIKYIASLLYQIWKASRNLLIVMKMSHSYRITKGPLRPQRISQRMSSV